MKTQNTQPKADAPAEERETCWVCNGTGIERDNLCPDGRTCTECGGNQAATGEGAAPRGGIITAAYIRHYRDSGQKTAYIEWRDGSRTEGDPNNAHMLALLSKAHLQGTSIRKEVW